MKSMSIRVMVFLAIVVISTKCVQAVPITFIHEGRGDVMLGGASLGVVDFTITAYGDTNDRIGSVDRWQTPHTSASIAIGRTSYDFLDPTYTSASHAMMDSGVEFGSEYAGDLIAGPYDETNLLHPDWDMLSSVGPVTGEIGLLGAPVDTTGGMLFLIGEGYTGTFTATVVPEPTTLLLLGLGAAMVRRRRT